jgi:outer membrane murein-binding lipoprotein Lpp
MKKSYFVILFLAVIALVVLLPAGCDSDAKTDALIGGAIGAGVGQAVGRNTEGTLIGAAVGAGAGYVIGSQSDKKKAEEESRQQEAYAQQQAQAQPLSANETIWITNSNGSKTSVVLRQEGNYWYGPKGERYETKPTEQQLKEVYGF